jgi:hypothetical protein
MAQLIERVCPEVNPKSTLNRHFCPRENCPADTLLAATQRCAAPASSITLRFE